MFRAHVLIIRRSKLHEAWNKTYFETKFCASSWLNTEINILRCTVSKTSKLVLCSIIFPPENCGVYEILWQNVAQLDMPKKTIWRMRIACWILKATIPLSEYVILTAFPLTTMHERALSVLLHVHCLVTCLKLRNSESVYMYHAHINFTKQVAREKKNNNFHASVSDRKMHHFLNVGIQCPTADSTKKFCTRPRYALLVKSWSPLMRADRSVRSPSRILHCLPPKRRTCTGKLLHNTTAMHFLLRTYK